MTAWADLASPPAGSRLLEGGPKAIREVDLREVLRRHNVGASEHLAHRQAQDLQVEPQAPVVDVPDVEREPILEPKRMAPGSAAAVG
jgi:hypothetical protein